MKRTKYDKIYVERNTILSEFSSNNRTFPKEFGLTIYFQLYFDRVVKIYSCSYANVSFCMASSCVICAMDILKDCNVLEWFDLIWLTGLSMRIYVGSY